MAAEGGNIEVIRLLLGNLIFLGIDDQELEDLLKDPLKQAVKSGHLEAVKDFLNLGEHEGSAENKLLQTKDLEGNTLLHIAAFMAQAMYEKYFTILCYYVRICISGHDKKKQILRLVPTY